MNKEEAKAELEKFLSDIRFHHSLTSELLSILKKSGSEGKFFRLFTTRLKYLNAFGRNAAILQPRAF
jgi:hypothetical protein